MALRRPDLARRLVMIRQNVNQQGLPAEVVEMMKPDKMPAEPHPPMLQQL